MRRLTLLVFAFGCGSESEPEAALPDASTATVDRDDACSEFAVAFCAKSTPCYPDIPLEWCIAQEDDVCHEWESEPVLVRLLEECREAIRALDCPPEGEDFVPPSACCDALGCP